MATIGSEAINRTGQFGNVTTGYRCFVELANPASGSGYIISVSAYFASARAGQTGYILTMVDEGSGVFSSRDYEAVTFPDATGLKTWEVVLEYEDGDYIGIALPIAAVTGDIGIDTGTTDSPVGVRTNFIASSMPIASGSFSTLYSGYAISLLGTTGTPTLPSVTTQAVSSIVTTTATGNGNVTDLGNSAVTQHGHCWNTTGTPDTDDSKTTNGAAATTGAFTSSLTGLTIGTVYFVRAYATNSAGTSYGDEVNFLAGVVGGELRGNYAVVEERFHYVDAYGFERYIQGELV